MFLCIQDDIRGFPVTTSRDGTYQLWLVGVTTQSHPAHPHPAAVMPFAIGLASGAVVQFTTMTALVTYVNAICEAYDSPTRQEDEIDEARRNDLDGGGYQGSYLRDPR